MTRYGMAIDLNRCYGCQTCMIACKIANNTPKKLAYNVVYTKNDEDYSHWGAAVVRGDVTNDSAGGEFPNAVLSFLPVQCQHCANPACLAACPTGATQQREDGIVWVDHELCIGCESCIKACPYEGVRTLIGDSPEYYVDAEVGEFDAPVHAPGTVEKCTFCFNLIDRGEVPACMQLCPGRARYWGDLDDPESDISRVIAGRETMFLMEDAGTQPSVYYLK